MKTKWGYFTRLKPRLTTLATPDHYDAETGAWDRQLPNADIAKATQPDMWEGVDVSAFGADRPRFIENLQRADRMELAAALADVSPTARLVAVVLASHGWISWPGRDRLATLLQMERQNISRATKELETAGIIAKLQPYATSKERDLHFPGPCALHRGRRQTQPGPRKTWNQSDSRHERSSRRQSDSRNNAGPGRNFQTRPLELESI